MIRNLISRRSPSVVASATAGSCTAPTPTPVKTSQTCYHRNQQYSIVGLTNATGTLVERYSYTAYGTLSIYAANGTVRSSSTYANRYTYTGREWDVDLRLYHFRARWYDPSTGGFVSRDPLGYVDGMSLYRGYFGLHSLDHTGTLSTIEGPGFWKETDCGGFRQRVRWKPSPNETAQAPGYVIQMVCMNIKFVDCDGDHGPTLKMGGGDNQQSCDTGCYLEFWPVDKKGVVGNIEWRNFKDADFFAFSGRNNSRGSVVIQGVALFVSLEWLTENGLLGYIAQFGTGAGGVASAGSLPSVCLREDNRAFWDLLQNRAGEYLTATPPADRSIQRRAYAIWDCCGKTKEETCSTTKPRIPGLERTPEREDIVKGIDWWWDGSNVVPLMPDFFW